jgi:NitT/TauT family transport system substrate-binding protein
LDKAAAGSEVMAFLAQGQIDVGAVGLSAAAFNALNKGFDLKVIASAALGPDKNSPTKFEVRKALVDGGQVKKIGDLKGKKIAVAGGAGSAGAYLAVKALQTDGLSAKDVEFVNLANPDMLLALKNGAVDAALIGTPFSTQAVEQGVGSILIDDWLPGYSTTTYMYSGKFIKEKPLLAQKFAVALLKGFRAIIGNDYLSDENVKSYVKYTGSNEQTIKATPPLVYDNDMGIAKDSIKDQEKIFRESGWTDYKQAIDVEKAFDTSFVDYALKILKPTKK